ncbi:MAG TPA: flagellar export chaperone FlgN [Candidatus Dormibacteraeota bacterium]|nr:flagellar export chaperone FlgN [Candidatus Dormibacteraeota bacterium]
MSAMQPYTSSVSSLERDVLAHLEAQIESAQRLLGSILTQGAAIRERDVEGVLARLGDIKTEMDLRARLESERTDLLVRAGAQLGVPGAAVTLEAMTSLMSDPVSALARERSATLRGLLDEVVREHGINRALMRQELSFLDHLVRLLGQEPETGYRPGGPAPTPQSHNVLNLHA